MPVTREEHIGYTRSELNNYEYYVDIFNILKNENIKSYIDIGANIGEFCNVMYEKLNTLEDSYLFEPENENFIFLQSHIKNKSNLYKLAIGYGGTKGKMICMNNNVGGFVLDNNLEGDIEISTLEDLNLPLVDLVKIDVEGGEFDIIDNSTYLKDVKWIEVEFHKSLEELKNNYTIDYVKDRLPNHEIVVYDKNKENPYGRMLLRLI